VEQRPAFLGPKATSVLTLPIISEILTAVQQKKLRVYIFGGALYRDTLNGDNHITRACWELSYIPVDISGQQIKSAVMPRCGIHNCTDEECEREDSNHPDAAPK
jgi:hypothetical protein